MVAVEDGARDQTGNSRISGEIAVYGVEQMGRAKLQMQERLAWRADSVKLRPAGEDFTVRVIAKTAHGKPWRIGDKPVKPAGEKPRPVGIAQNESPDAIAAGDGQLGHAMDQREDGRDQRLFEVGAERNAERSRGAVKELRRALLGR